MLTREQILAANDLPTIEVDVPEWGGTVRVSTMTAGARDKYEKLFIGRDGKASLLNATNIRAALVAFTLVDADGKRVFVDGDIERLSNKSAAAVDRIFEASAKLNKVTKQDVDELEKNSG